MGLALEGSTDGVPVCPGFWAAFFVLSGVFDVFPMWYELMMLCVMTLFELLNVEKSVVIVI